jgi:hypothetical protein
MPAPERDWHPGNPKYLRSLPKLQQFLRWSAQPFSIAYSVRGNISFRNGTLLIQHVPQLSATTNPRFLLPEIILFSQVFGG